MTTTQHIEMLLKAYDTLPLLQTEIANKLSELLMLDSLSTQRLYSEKELVLFGKYLLSNERKQSILANPSFLDDLSDDERLKEIYDADLRNFLDLQ